MTTKRMPKPQTSQLVARIDTSMLERIQAKADEYKTTVSAITREALNIWLNMNTVNKED